MKIYLLFKKYYVFFKKEFIKKLQFILNIGDKTLKLAKTFTQKSKLI